ncbi:SdhA [Legionella sp. 227]|uniref:SdhA n=1 Tax=Legionella sp. 227 TaxID=3367288 RepID=UPI00370D92D7
MIFEEYVKLLESFKKNQISKILEQIDTKIFDILYSKHVSPLIVPYFPRYELCFMSDEAELKDKNIYIREKNGKIAYSVIIPSEEGAKDKKEVKDVVLKELDAPIPFKYNIGLMTHGLVPEKGSFYARIIDAGLEYTVIDPQGKLITSIIKKEELKLNLRSGFSPKDLEPFMPEILRITSKRNHTLPFTPDAFRARVLSAAARNGHIQWAPFSNYDLDPDNISQIKKLINALYHARLTFLDLENIDVRDLKRSYTDLTLLYGKTINSAYEASYLLTHLDVDLTDMFNEELALILPVFSQIQAFADNYAKEQKAFVKALKPMPLASQIGEIAGIAVDQLRPISSDVDYNFLAQFSAVLPSYIDKLTHYIEQYSSQIKKSEPKLNQEKLAELQKAALSLLNDIENLKGNRFFLSFKFLNYIHIISNLITLSMSTLEQIGELSESSQDLVRDKLAQLKYTLLPTLFGFVDKIEDNAMLKPGTLSVPLMEKIKVLYEKILYLPKKAIDFKEKGADLLEIEDPRFIELRLEMTYKRIDKDNKSLYKIKKANTACKEFFELLQDPRYRNLRLYQLPPEVKKELIKLYKLIKPYMAQLDIDLNEVIISRLTGPEKEDWYSFMGSSISKLKRQLPSDHISFVLKKEKALKNLITKDENSKVFHIKLNKDLIDSVHKKANLVLFPYSEKANVYTVDESIPLQVESKQDKTSRISKSRFLEIQAAYLRFVHLVKEQIAAKPGSFEKNLDLSKLDDAVKAEFQRLFKVFQPYLGSMTSTECKDSAKNLELYLADLFAQNPITNIPLKSSFLSLDKNIQSFFDYINFEWFNKDEFQNIRTAYTQFSQIIKKQIEEKPQLYGNNLLLTSFDNETKNKCLQLFQVFQPYFKLGIPPELKEAAQNFEKYLAAFLANKPVEILEAPPVSLFLQLDKHTQDSFAKWQDKSQTFYDFANTRFLDEKESEALKSKREKDAKLLFKQVEDDKLLHNLDQLNSDQALEIYQWYQNKHNKFLVVTNAYSQFLELLHKAIKDNPQIRKNISLLSSLKPGVKAQLRNLYSIFQPYLICALPPEQQEDALNFDNYLVASLSNRTIYRRDAPPVLMFLGLKDHFRETFIRVTNEWKRRKERFYNLAQDKFTLENDAAVLKADPKTGREHFVIQHTNYSKCIHAFRQSLFEVTKLFNSSMQQALTPYTPPKTIDISPIGMLKEAVQTVFPPSVVPFPEMEDNNKRLSQSRQVCALKDIFNSLFHLEGIVHELENLNNQSIKTQYVRYLLQAYEHLNEIIKSAQRLAADPHLRFIARDLLNKAQDLYATFQEHSDAYQVAPEQVSYEAAKVQYNALWYIINAFYISPKHIRALNNTNYLTTEELDELHFRAKKSTSIIEGLINNSNSYFKLFLQSPNMIFLYQELTAKLNEFTSTSHDAIMDNMENMRSSIFTPMLLEADRWENRLGLSPGILSGPLRQITNEFFKGLVHPLPLSSLDSKTRIRLIYDKEPLEKRISLATKQIKRNQKYLKKIDKDYKDIENLYYWYRQVTTPLDFFDFATPQPQVESTKAKMELCAAYKKALPKLAQLKRNKKVEIAPSPYPEHHTLDALCNSGLKAYDPHFTEIEALIVASHHYYLGLKATHQMRLETTEEHLAYLKSLEPIQEQEKLSFIEEYTTESFEKNLEAKCNPIDLQFTDQEYVAELKAYLMKLKDEIIAKAKVSKNIDRSIEKLLEIEISKFEKKYYAEYYHLDTVQVALAQFKTYFKDLKAASRNRNSIFESKETLNKKSKCIRLLDEIARNKTLKVQERIQQIKLQVENPNFSRIMLAHKQVDTFSWTYLKMCFLSLLEALNLYTPTRQKLLDNINEAVHNPPEIKALTQRLGLFAAKTAKDADAKRYEAPAMPAATPSA